MSYHVSLQETMVNARRIVQERGTRTEGRRCWRSYIDDSIFDERRNSCCSAFRFNPQSVGCWVDIKCKEKMRRVQKLIEDAKKCEEAGAIALVLECVPMQLAELISEQLTIPTIGIGAGQKVDGQVLVYHDLYLIRRKSCSKFVKQYTSVQEEIVRGISQYVTVDDRQFPEEKHSFTMKEEECLALYGGKQ